MLATAVVSRAREATHHVCLPPPTAVEVPPGVATDFGVNQGHCHPPFAPMCACLPCQLTRHQCHSCRQGPIYPTAPNATRIISMRHHAARAPPPPRTRATNTQKDKKRMVWVGVTHGFAAGGWAGAVAPPTGAGGGGGGGVAAAAALAAPLPTCPPPPLNLARAPARPSPRWTPPTTPHVTPPPPPAAAAGPGRAAAAASPAHQQAAAPRTPAGVGDLGHGASRTALHVLPTRTHAWTAKATARPTTWQRRGSLPRCQHRRDRGQMAVAVRRPDPRARKPPRRCGRGVAAADTPAFQQHVRGQNTQPHQHHRRRRRELAAASAQPSAPRLGALSHDRNHPAPAAAPRAVVVSPWWWVATRRTSIVSPAQRWLRRSDGGLEKKGVRRGKG
jgi:hypothetical protein